MGIGFEHRIEGHGETVVLVHGAYGDVAAWALLAPLLAESRTVVTYSRRGHGADAPPSADVIDRRLHENDLAGLIEALDVGPVHVAGYSYGGSVALGLAARRPELFRSVSAHEPALGDTAPDDPLVRAACDAIEFASALIADGEMEAGLRHFVENVALGPGGWDMLPPEVKDRTRHNAHGFPADARHPGWGAIDLAALARTGVPTQITRGDVSLPFYAVIADAVLDGLPEAESLTIVGANHVPHMTRPEEYAAALVEFQRRAGALRLAA